MLIRVALWMMFSSVPLFLLAKILLSFSFVQFATFDTKFAAFLLLFAFGLLIVGAVFSVLKRIFDFILHYFSEKQRAYRHVLFVKNTQTNQKRRFYFQRLQLNYFKEQQRRYLLEKNNRTQINTLTNSIERQLQSIKHEISKDYFSQLQLENRRYQAQQNEQALLELHHKISTISDK